MRYHLKEERYIFPLIIILWLCNKYIINYYAISCKILMCTLDQNYLFHVYSNGKTFYNFLINTAWPPKLFLRFFLWCFNLSLKPHYVYTAWLHKISPTLIVCRICSINSIRNPRHWKHGFADNRSKNNIYQNQASRGTNAGANFIQSRHFMSKIVVEKSQKL